MSNTQKSNEMSAQHVRPEMPIQNIRQKCQFKTSDEMSQQMSAGMSITHVRKNCQQPESYAFARLFLFLDYPEASFRYTTILLMKNNREDAQPMHFLDCCRTCHGRVIPRNPSPKFPSPQSEKNH